MKRKILYTLGISITLTVFCASFFSKNESNANANQNFTLASTLEIDGSKISIANGKVDAFPNLEELEKHSDLIVKGVRLDSNEVLTTTEIGTIKDLYTESTFKVSKVLKGSLNKKDTIKVVEPVGTFKGVISSFEGYKAMKKDGEYILFLFKDPQNDRYGIVAVNQGKYSTNGSVDIYEDNKENPEYKRIEKFTNMVVNKYLKQPEPQPQQPHNNDSVTDSVYKKNTESVTNSVYDKK